MKFRKLIAAVMCAALGITLCGCKPPKEPLPTEPDTPPVLTTHKTVKTDGAFEITRRELGDTPMGEDGTWTIFVYMSGSDLEEGRSNGTRDIEEMLAASTGENVRFIIQTGGSNKWKNDYANAESLGRFMVSNGELTKLGYIALDSMAKGSTLRNFLKWGIENYAAENMGLIFWGHGKGTIGGVCKDSLFKGNYLPIEDLNGALSETAALMTDKFEFIGFDNCYMATAEIADIAATYANYMIASEEIEPADGWDYTVLGNLLGSDPHADWDTIAKTLCDGFVSSNADSREASRITLSVIDLSRLDDFLVKFDAYTNDLCGAFDNTASLIEFETYLDCAEHFGDNNGFEGYSNSADIKDIIKAGSKFSSKTNELLTALDELVIYMINGEEHKNAGGLTVYYPFKANGSDEMKTFARLCITPHYLELIDRKQLNSALVPGKSSGSSPIAEHWRDYINNGTKTLNEYLGGSDEPEFYDDETEKDTNTQLTAETKYENGSYTISLAPDSLNEISQVGINVYREMEKNSYRAYGTKPCADFDLKTGVFSDSLDECWLMFKNRDPLQIKRRRDGKYIAQLHIGENDSIMLLDFDEKTKAASIDCYQAVDENGALYFKKPTVGDTVMALYDSCTKKGEKYRTQKATDYVMAAEPNVIYDTLPDGNYYYIVIVDDIRGNRYETTPVTFAVKNGKLDFTPQPEAESQ